MKKGHRLLQIVLHSECENNCELNVKKKTKNKKHQHTVPVKSLEVKEVL